MEPELFGAGTKCKARSEIKNPFIESLSKYELAKKTMNMLDKFNRKMGYALTIHTDEVSSYLSEAAKKWEPILQLRRAAIAYENAKVQLERLAIDQEIDTNRHLDHVSIEVFDLFEKHIKEE